MSRIRRAVSGTAFLSEAHTHPVPRDDQTSVSQLTLALPIALVVNSAC